VPPDWPMANNRVMSHHRVCWPSRPAISAVRPE